MITSAHAGRKAAVRDCSVQIKQPLPNNFLTMEHRVQGWHLEADFYGDLRGPTDPANLTVIDSILTGITVRCQHEVA